MTDLLDLAAAQQARDEGMARVNTNSAIGWRERVDLGIEFLAATGGEFTADDLHEQFPSLGNGHHPNAMGARFAAAARRGLIQRIGYRPSARVSVHGHPVAVWRGVRS